MGQSQSQQPPHEVPIEELSHQLALSFATKCYTHLEVAHFKDNFKSLADHNDGVEYWKEDTLCKFLCLPESLRAGPVIYQMCTYLGAFPFPSLAPCILTREAMLKVVTIMTGRYKKILKRGNRDKTKLLFRSLAVFDRRASTIGEKEKPKMEDIIREQKPDEMLEEEAMAKEGRNHVSGFAVDESHNDDEDEDDDDLALAALDSLDAIEVFKHDQRMDRKINHAFIPADHLKKLILLLLLYGGLRPQESLSAYVDELNDPRARSLEESAQAVVAAFDPDLSTNGIRYSNFIKVTSTTMPDLFDTLGAVFEHFLFSKHIDLSKHKGMPNPSTTETQRVSPIYRAPSDSTGSIFTDSVLSQLSVSLKLASGTSTPINIYSSHARFNQIFSIASHGTSLSSFSRQVMSWSSPSLLLLSGTTADSQTFLLGAYLPQPWRDSSSSHSSPPALDLSAPRATLFQLLPRHAIFPANPTNTSMPISYFSTKNGIALGCVIPQQSRTGAPTPPILGPASIFIDKDISSATISHNIDLGQGVFVPDPALVEAQAEHADTTQPVKVELDIDALEVWGISFPDPTDGEDALTRQMKKLKWEDEEAARRAGANFGGDKDGARTLLEMAGLVGNNRSGGSV